MSGAVPRTFQHVRLRCLDAPVLSFHLICSGVVLDSLRQVVGSIISADETWANTVKSIACRPLTSGNGAPLPDA
jgi:hypothetical protein